MGNLIKPIYVNSTLTAAVPSLETDTPPINQSLATSFQTVATNLGFLDKFCYQINITTTNSQGTFSVVVSNDKQNWTTLGACGTANAANDTITVEIVEKSFHYAALAYSSTTAGTGTCSILFTASNIGKQ